MARRWLSWLRHRWLLCLVLIGALVLGALNHQEIGRILLTMLHGRPQWVLVAVALQLLCFVLYAVLYQTSFLTVEVESHWRNLVPVLFASICLKTIVPSGGVSGVALFVDDAAKRGQSSARAAQGALLVLAADLITMAPLLVFGLAYLWVRNALHTYQILGVAGFLAFSGGVVTLLLLGLWRPELLEGTLNGLQNAANALARRLRRKPWLADDWAQRNAAEFSGAALGIAKNPAHLGRTLVLALGIHLLDVLGLYAVFLAYRQPVDLGAVAVGFGLDVVFSVLSFIPHGIGVADGAITLALTSLGVPAAKALVVALVARGLNIWLPFVPGLFFLRKVRSFGSRGAAP